MTLLSRVVWFVLGLGLVLGAMLASAHFARAGDVAKKPCVEQEVPCGIACTGAKATTHYCDWDENGNYRPVHVNPDGSTQPIEISPVRAQINNCISYGIKHGRGVKTTDVKDPETKSQAENQDDWQNFCMQQAHWKLCETCQVNPEHNWHKHQTCSEAGSAAYYNDECWAWVSPAERIRKLPCTWGDCSGPSTTSFEKR